MGTPASITVALHDSQRYFYFISRSTSNQLGRQGRSPGDQRLVSACSLYPSPSTQFFDPHDSQRFEDTEAFQLTRCSTFFLYFGTDKQLIGHRGLGSGAPAAFSAPLSGFLSSTEAAFPSPLPTPGFPRILCSIFRASHRIFLVGGRCPPHWGGRALV